MKAVLVTCLTCDDHVLGFFGSTDAPESRRLACFQGLSLKYSHINALPGHNVKMREADSE